MTSNLRVNIIANFLGNLLVGLLSLAVIPLYIKLVGTDCYGVISFYATLLLLAFLLDFGLSATLNREMARFVAPNSSQDELRDLARTIEIIYWGIGLFIIGSIATASKVIATKWLTSATLTPAELQRATILMGVAIGLRWPFTLYSAGMLGLQKQVRQNVIFAMMETVRLLGALLVLALGYKVSGFFMWQAFISLAGTVVIYHYFWSVVCREGYHGKWDLSQVRKIKRFAGGMGSVGVLVTILVQTDKVILSKMLTLSEFGQYMAVGTLASGLYLIVKPIFSAHYPEITRLVASNDNAAENAVFQHGYQLVAVLIVPVAVALVMFSRDIITIWLGSGVSGELPQVCSLLVLGTSFNALLNMPYALQLAHGRTGLAVKSNLIAVVVLIPIIILLTRMYGMRGAAAAWVILNTGYMCISIPIMSYQGLLRNGCWPFYRDGVVVPLGISLATVALSSLLIQVLEIKTMPYIVVSGTFGLILGIVLSMFALTETRPLLSSAAGRVRGLFSYEA